MSNTRVFTRTSIVFILLFGALLILCFTLSWTTRDSMAQLPFLTNQNRSAATPSNTLVDLQPWQTAQTLASLAVTEEEVTLAREAERLADHEVDQAFASALRQAQAIAQHRALTGDALRLSQKVAQLQQIVRADQARVQALANAPKDSLDIAKAQLGLESDELADAQQDLARALGDERTRIQQELSAHEASMKKYDAEVATQSQSAVVSSRKYSSLAQRLSAWFDQGNRYQLIQQAAQKADQDVIALNALHQKLEAQASPTSEPNADTAALLASLKDRSTRSQMLSIFDDRIQTEQQLASVYRKWSTQVLLQHRILFHLLMQSCALLLSILVGALLLHVLLRYFLQVHTPDRRRLSTRLIITKLILQLVSFILILLVVFGTPSQMPTIVGLTTAGLTVVLQDFILSFLGWFVLMGKNGIRVGDWVEINGIGGEVIDIGLFRTGLLEIGNWTDHGHPTGRRVTFINSFAIKGQYFNFSTTGQWMWDEITITVPASEDAYHLVEEIHKAVLEETEAESKLAEGEWKRLARNNSLNQFRAAPAVNLRPGVNGIDVLVRYVTRASNRYEVRNRLYERVLGILHKPLLKTPAAKTDA